MPLSVPRLSCVRVGVGGAPSRAPPPTPAAPAAGLATEIGPLVQRLVRNLLKRVHGVQAQAGYAKMQSQQQQQ
jgi:hypothetical protein